MEWPWFAWMMPSAKRAPPSEYGEADHTGLTLASNLNLDFRWLHNVAWCYWQALDGSSWGLLDADPARGTYGGPATKYFVLAQFSRHIRPGMVLLDSGDANTVAAYDAARARLVLVTTTYKRAQNVTYSLALFGRVGAGAHVTGWRTATDGSARYAPLAAPDVANASFTARLGADEVTTFEVTEVRAY